MCSGVLRMYHKEEMGLEGRQDGWAWFAIEKRQYDVEVATGLVC